MDDDRQSVTFRGHQTVSNATMDTHSLVQLAGYEVRVFGRPVSAYQDYRPLRSSEGQRPFTHPNSTWWMVKAGMVTVLSCGLT